LKECTPEEFNEFKKLNIEYKKKFNFPFIIAVKEKNKNEILNYFKFKNNRLLNLNLKKFKFYSSRDNISNNI